MSAIRRWHRKEWTDADMGRLRDMTAAGVSTAEIAAILGHSVNGINLRRQRSGIARPKTGSDIERFESRYTPEPNSGCWLWLASCCQNGYGFFTVKQPDGSWKGLRAHRWAWQNLHGPVPAGLELDHLCRNRACVNPAHLEAVTHQENVKRGTAGSVQRAIKLAATHCKRGHLLDSANTHVNDKGHRNCRACWRVRAAKAKAKRDGQWAA